MKIYVASSWRNKHQPGVVRLLRDEGHAVYDFRNPMDDGPTPVPGHRRLPNGFHWSEIDPFWEDWTAEEYRSFLRHPLAEAGFYQDSRAVAWCDVCLLVQPCGRSAHLELGYAMGLGRPGIMYYPDEVNVEPELMAKWCREILVGKEELRKWQGVVSP